MTKLRSLVLAAFLALPFATSFAQVNISVGIAPPALPVYEQPACPVAGYIWTPGYWAWDQDYYWVPGVWVAPPRVGLLWTPGWWGWSNGAYAFNQGYWGSTVGFYGGVNYGFGYTGNGYWGGRWNGNNFQYNTAITRVNKTIINNNTYVNNNFNRNVNANRTSFNGGANGIKAEPNAEQRAAMANKKEGPTSQQLDRQQLASKDQNLRASVNKGKPNQEAIRSFNKNEGVGQGKGAQEVGAAGGAAGAGKAGNGPEPMAQHKEGAGAGAGTGMGGEEHGKIGQNDNAGNKHERENLHGNNQNVGENQVGKHNKGVEHNGVGNGQNAMNKQMNQHRQQQMNAQHHQQQMMGKGGQHQQNQMKARNAQMNAGKHPQGGGGGGNPRQGGQQQQGKKKPNQH